MPRYAVYETQTILVAYFVEADNPDQAHELVDQIGATEYDEFVKILDYDIDETKTQIETPNGWRLLEG